MKKTPSSKTIPFRKFIILIAFLHFFQLIASAQSIFEQIGRLPVTTYSAEEYGGDPNVLSAIQSDAGLMYFGTSFGLHEYDGVSWRSLFDRNTTLSINNFTKYAQGKIFYAGQDFGYLEVDAEGETKAVSLVHLIPEELRTNFLAWEIHYFNGYILLRTQDHHLIRLELAEDFTLKSLKTWQAEIRFGGSFVVGEDFYITEAERGLSRLIGDEIKLIPNTESLGIERINVMLPYSGSKEKSFLLGRPVTGFYLFDGTSVSKFPTEVDQQIKEGYALIGAILHQGNYILRLYGGGMIIMNAKGKILNRIGTEQGLPSDVVKSIYLDHAQGLWAMTEDGMARIAIDSPIQTFGKELGINSEVKSIQKQGESFFLGTSTGLVKFDKKSKTFQSVTEINSTEIRDLDIDGKDLIIPSSQLQLYREGKAIKLDFPKDASRPYYTLIPKNNPNLLLVGTTTGLLLYERGLSKEFPWELKGKFPSVGQGIYRLLEGKDGTVFAIGFRKTYLLNLDGIGLESAELSRIKSSALEYDSFTDFFMRIEGEIYSYFAEKVKKYSSKEGKFEITEEFSEVEKDIFDLNQGKAGIIWYESKAGKKFILKKDEAGKFVKDETPNSVSPYLSGLDFIDEDSIMWFGSPKGLIRYDPKKDNQDGKQFFTLIRRIETKTDTLPLAGYGRIRDIAPPELKDNSFRFEFAAPYFGEEKKTKYQTYLEGFEADWVDWNDNRFKEYTNLSPGTYTFHVRAQAFTGRVSEEAVFSFIVLPPLYATWWAYLIYALLFGGLITAIVKWRSQKLKAENRMLEKRVNERTAELEKSLTELKSTQAQLIQSEKMASLGELTAGIAHEIQNPLNFVNNFSEVSQELLHELKEELDKGEISEAKIISNDVIENLAKINHHGKRADAIVKGMLEHSRSVSGEKELTNLNTLANEYLNLAYQSFKNKNKDFKGTIQTDFDSALPKIKIARQEIGRVLLNLINNAFYACNELNGQDLSGFQNLTGLTPTVTVSTKNLSHKIEISISDNGPGIPDSIKDKIFQPFFTTKPTGQGTGLGLSLSYDIVKSHGGEIVVDSQEGIGTTFKINLPI